MKQRLLVIDRGNRQQPVSYSNDWVDVFRAQPHARVDVLSSPWLLRWGRKLIRLQLADRYDAIFIMHSVSNDMGFGYHLVRAIRTIRGPRFFFLGNEYRDLAAKVNLANELECRFLLSQLPGDIAEALYGPFFAGRIVSVPHALNESVFTPVKPMDLRPIDLGYRGEKYPYYLGHNEREILSVYFQQQTARQKLRLHFATGRGRGVRLDRKAWASYLNDCRCTIGTETGAEYLSCSDKLRYQVNSYRDAHPDAAFETVRAAVIEPLCKADRFVNGRAVSSRHFDAIGCGTALISFPGRFNDILQSEEHYISVARDFSNAETVFSRLSDTRYLTELTRRTRDWVLQKHCLRHRMADLQNFY